jgi:hypothetical protein
MSLDNKPRHNCWHYVLEHGGSGVCLSKEDFNALCDDGFADGPFKETFGSGHGEPYNPWRQAYGTLKDGRVVYCELHP